MKLSDHPSVQRVRERLGAASGSERIESIEASWLRAICLEAGADDVGFVEIGREALQDESQVIRGHFPRCRSLISIVCKMNRAPIRSSARSVANLEFHHVGDCVNEVCSQIVSKLEEKGVVASNPSMGFPMEMDQFPGRIWVVSHKLVAQQAGLGVMGIHRNVIHPKFGNFILLGTIVLDTEITEYASPLNYTPCLECKLCVAACPVGAISPDGYFNFNACYTHNYREFMGGFTDWVEDVADSKDRYAYRDRVRDDESASMWQSLSHGANYKAAYCLSVCPAGEDVLAPFLIDQKQFLADHLRPLQDKPETIYVVPGSDAEAHVTKRFPNKSTKRVRGSLRPRTIDQFMRGLPLVFQPGQAKGLDATYHFTFKGKEQRRVTVVIRDQRVEVQEGHEGQPTLRVVADTSTWLGFLAKEKYLVWALMSLRVLILGNPLWLIRFGKCFPS